MKNPLQLHQILEIRVIAHSMLDYEFHQFAQLLQHLGRHLNHMGRYTAQLQSHVLRKKFIQEMAKAKWAHDPQLTSTVWPQSDQSALTPLGWPTSLPAIIPWTLKLLLHMTSVQSLEAEDATHFNALHSAPKSRNPLSWIRYSGWFTKEIQKVRRCQFLCYYGTVFPILGSMGNAKCLVRFIVSM